MKLTLFKTLFAALLALVVSSQLFASTSDYLLVIEGTKGEGKGKTVTLTENSDGSFTATNLLPGMYKLIAKPKVVVAGSNSLSGGSTFMATPQSFKFECVVSPRDAASGQASGKRTVATGQSTGKREHHIMVVQKHNVTLSPDGVTVGNIKIGDHDNGNDADSYTKPKKEKEVDSAPKGYDLKISKVV